jgi:C-terminal processing protease CtpA/Prc
VKKSNIVLMVIFLLPFSFIMTSSSLKKDSVMNRTKIDHIIKSTIVLINQYYVFHDKALQIENKLNALLSESYFKPLNNNDFAQLLTKEIQKISNDLHFNIIYSENEILENTKFDPEIYKLNNYGIQKIENLAGNIGYVKINYFAPLTVAKDIYLSMFKLISNTDALIIDLWDNGGGEPDTVNFLESYLIDNSQELKTFTVYDRNNNIIKEYYISSDFPTKKYKRDIFVLTSIKTFSGAEDLTYVLKNLKRATIIGEKTQGGANMIDEYKINNHFYIRIPIYRVIYEQTKSNWDNVGITPDIPMSPGNALNYAHIKAIESIIKKNVRPEMNEESKKLLQFLKSKN